LGQWVIWPNDLRSSRKEASHIAKKLPVIFMQELSFLNTCHSMPLREMLSIICCIHKTITDCVSTFQAAFSTCIKLDSVQVRYLIEIAIAISSIPHCNVKYSKREIRTSCDFIRTLPPPVYRPPVYRPPVYRPPVYRPPVYRPPADPVAPLTNAFEDNIGNICFLGLIY